MILNTVEMAKNDPDSLICCLTSVSAVDTKVAKMAMIIDQT